MSLLSSSLIGCGGQPGNEPGQGEPAVAATATAAQAYDGETVLRGLFFGRGPVAAKLPGMWGDGAAVADLPSKIDPQELAEKVDSYAATLCESGCSETTRAGLKSAAARLRSGEKDRVIKADRFAKFTRAQGPTADGTIDAILASIASNDPAFVDRFGADMQSGNPVRVDRAIAEAGRRILESGIALAQQTHGGLGFGGLQPLAIGRNEDEDKAKDDDDDDGPVALVFGIAVAVVVVAVVAVVVTLQRGERVGSGLDHDLWVAGVTNQLQRI